MRIYMPSINYVNTNAHITHLNIHSTCTHVYIPTNYIQTTDTDN